MRGSDTEFDGSGDDRIINPDGEATERLKAMLDAQWGREESGTEEEVEAGAQAE
jgi:virulence-associated protein VagC